MKRLRALLIVAALLSSVPSAHASDSPAGNVVRIETRTGVTVPLYTVWRSDALATIILFSGGAGGYGPIGADGWPGSGNFLIRTGKLWAAHPFNIVMVGRPSDDIDLSDGRVRTGISHGLDNIAIIKAVKLNSAAPIWLIGTSMGTISAAAAAIADQQALVAGLVLSSSITAYKIRGAVPTQDLAGIRVPTLVVYHEHDACWACRPWEAKNIASALKNAPIKKTLMISAGTGASGDNCGAFHYHGYIGVEADVVNQIAAWIRQPQS